MFRRLGFVIVAPLVLLAVLTAGLGAFLNYGKFAASLSEVENARFTIVAESVKAGIEANLNLGLSLPALSVAQNIIERELAADPDARAVMLYATDGALLYVAGQRFGLRRAPASWNQPTAWAGEGDDWRGVGLPLYDGLGRQVGGVAVLYSRAEHDRVLADIAGRLTSAAVAAAAATGLLALLGAGLLLRRLGRATDALADRIASHPDAIADIAAQVDQP